MLETPIFSEPRADHHSTVGLGRGLAGSVIAMNQAGRRVHTTRTHMPRLASLGRGFRPSKQGESCSKLLRS